jgi:hypothetical protein
MNHIKSRWAATQLAEDNVGSYVWLPKGADQQGRYSSAMPQPEAAHAASELDDEDPRPIPGAGPVVWLVLASVVAAALVAVLA